MMFEPFHFLRPAALLLVPVSGLVWWAWQRNRDALRGWRAQVEPELLEAMTVTGDARHRRPWLLLACWLLACIALAGPSWKPEPSPFAEDVTPLVVLLKADVSMDTPDPEPSRMERAHLKLADLAKARAGQPLGLIAYAGSAHLVLPPTRDTGVVAGMAREVSAEIMPRPGDRLDLAVASAADVLGGGTLLVVTDTAGGVPPGLADAWRKAGSPDTQVLAVAAPDVPLDPLEPLAKALAADLVQMTDDDTDIDRIVQGASRPPVARAADGSTIWRDGGYYFVPVLALMALLPFRREAEEKPSASS